MAKGYWIAHMDVRDPENYKQYIATAAPAFERFGANFIARGGKVVECEGKPRARNVIIEFPSLQHAIDCYNSPEYQEAVKIRQKYADGELMLLEGV